VGQVLKVVTTQVRHEVAPAPDLVVGGAQQQRVKLAPSGVARDAVVGQRDDPGT
jgi:hypothetical protein